MSYTRKMAIDYGDSRIGIAMTDLLCVICSPHSSINAGSFAKDTNIIAELIASNFVDTVVIGLPLNMDGSEGARALKAKQFGERLQSKTAAKVVYWDERLSSVEAESLLAEKKMTWQKKQKLVDKLAACLILESYMSCQK